MISAPRAVNSGVVIALTVALVPTGMKQGVSMVPWSVTTRPRRAIVSGQVFKSV